MPDSTNALLAPNVSSYSNPNVNLLLAGGGTGSNAMDTSTSNALQIANQAQQLQSNKVAIDQQTFNLAKAKLDAVHQLLGSVVANPTDDTFTTQLGIGVKAGTVDPQTAADLASHVAAFGGDRQKIQQFALDGLNNNASHMEILQQAFGAPSLVNVGGSLQSVRTVTGPNAGTYAAGGGSLPVTMTPADKVAAGRGVINGVGGGNFVPGSKLYDDRGNYIGGQGGGSGDKFVDAANGAGGNGSSAPPPIVGGNRPPPMPAGVTPPARALSPAGTGAAPAQPTAPQGQGAPSAGQPGGAPGMVTPTLQTLPVITDDMANAARAKWQNGESTPADRNIIRGWAVQRNMDPRQVGPFEPQPAGVGAAAPVQTRQSQGGAPAAPGSTGQPAAAPVQAAAGQAPAAGQGAGSGVGPNGLVTSLSPGQQASLAAGANGYGALSADVSAPTGVNQRLFQLRTALGALRNTQTGLGTAQRHQLVGYMASLPGGLDKWMPGVDPNSATAYDVATKYLNAYALNTPGAARSDAGLSTAQSANANTSAMMQRAAMDVTTSNIGLEVGKQALLNAFEKSHTDPGLFNKFAAQWGQGVDPRAFALGDMTPAERAGLVNSLQGQQQQNFLATIRKGLAAGVLHRSDLKGAIGNGQ